MDGQDLQHGTLHSCREPGYTWRRILDCLRLCHWQILIAYREPSYCESIPGALQQLPMQRPRGQVECTRIDQCMATSSCRNRSQLRESNIITEAQPNTREFCWLCNLHGADSACESYQCQKNSLLCLQQGFRFPERQQIGYVKCSTTLYTP